MPKKNEVKKISYKNWLSSRKKWRKIVEKTEAGENFVNQRGFEDLVVVSPCGYCKHVDYHYCGQCQLFKEGICSSSLWSGRGEIPFWKYVIEMCGLMEEKPVVYHGVIAVPPESSTWDRLRVIASAREVLSAIEANEPHSLASYFERLCMWFREGLEGVVLEKSCK